MTDFAEFFILADIVIGEIPVCVFVITPAGEFILTRQNGELWIPVDMNLGDIQLANQQGLLGALITERVNNHIDEILENYPVNQPEEFFAIEEALMG